MIEKIKEQIEKDISLLSLLVKKDPLYPIEDVNLVLDRLRLNIADVQKYNDDNCTSRIGKWVQIHERSNKPYYGKVEDIPEVGFYTIEGLYASQDKKLVQRAVRQDMCLDVSREVGRALEFANDVNTLKPQPHLFK